MSSCQLCGDSADIATLSLAAPPSYDGEVQLCGACMPAARGDEAPTGGHWHCLRESIWSDQAAVQVLSFRLLHRLEGEVWAADQLEQAYLDEPVLQWAQAGLEEAAPDVQPKDSNGTPLQEGDSVTLIKDLVVKGANFTAKRGTLVKNIRVGDDPTHVEGRVNRMSIMLKTEFLKRAGA